MSDLLSEARDLFPDQFGGLSDTQLAEHLHSKYAPNYDKNEYYRFLGVEPPGFGEEFGKGMAKSFAEMGVLAMDAAPAVALSGLSKTLDYIGVDNSLEENARAKAEEAAQKLAEVQDKYGAQTQGYKNVKDITSALQYAGSMAGSGAGSTISTVVPGLLSGGATAIATAGGKAALKQGLKQAALKFGKNLTEDQVEAQVTKGVMSKAFSKGFQAGAMGTATAAETGSTYLQNLEDGIDAPGIAIVAGAIKGSLEVLPEFMAISRIFKSPEAKDALADATAKQVLKRFGYNVIKEQGKLGATEAATEALQSAVDIAANDFVNKRQTDLFSPQNIDNLIESGLAGFIGSGPGSVITGGIQTLKDIKPATVRPEDFKHEELTEEVLDGDLIMQDLKSALLVPAPKEDTGTSIIDQTTEAFKNQYNNVTISIPNFAEEMDARVATVRKDNLNAPEDILLGGISSRGSLGTARPDQKVNAISEQKQARVQEKAPELPVGLRTAKPRFNEYSLKFPSDFEKALYISTRKSKSKRGDDYRTWLKDSYGMTDYEIDQAADQVVNSIKNSQPDSKDSMRITVPKMEKPSKKDRITETIPSAPEVTDEPVPFEPVKDKLPEDPVAKAFREAEAARNEVQFQKAHHNTSEFKKWFSGSKTVDATGTPKVFYHGTPNPGFKEFSHSGKSVSGAYHGKGFYFSENPGEASEYSGYYPGAMGPSSTPAVYPVYLSIKNPYSYDKNFILSKDEREFIHSKIGHITADKPSTNNRSSQSMDWGAVNPEIDTLTYEDMVWYAKRLRDAGVNMTELDRKILENHGFDGKEVGEGEWVAFYPTQIKSVLNEGSFDPSNPDIAKQISGAMPRIESRDMALADLAFKNVRGIKFKNSPMLKQEQQRLEKLIKNVAGPKADVQFFDDMFAFEDPESNIANPVRGAQWLNTIGVALSFNNARGLSNTETALHEAFHFVHRWALTDGEKRLLANQKARMEEYVAQKTGAQIEDVSLFDTEEVAATAFGLWAEEHLNKQPPTPKLGPVNAVFKKIADVLRTIRDSFKKAGYKKFEDLFEDIADGKKAQEFLREVTEQDRLVRNQAAVAHARKVRSDRIIQTPQKKLLTAESLTKMAGDIAKEDLLEFTDMQEFMMKAFNTAPGMASKDPVWSIIFGTAQNQQQNNAILDQLVAGKLHELYKNPKRLQNASGVMDFLNSTSQKLLQDDSKGRLVYKKDGKLVALNSLVSGDVIAMRDAFNTVLKLWRETTNEKFKEIEGFDNVDQAIAHQENIVADPTMDQANLAMAEKRLIQLKETKKSLEHINRLLESDIPYFPRMAQGKYGVKIIDKTDPKRVLPQSFAMVGETLNGKPNPKELQEVTKRWAEELGYTGSQYEITPAFRLTRGKIYDALRKGDLKYNLELLGSLMESISPEIADEVQAAMDKISGGVARSRITAPFLERNDTLLYSKDYTAVIPAYFSNATKAINRYRYAEANDTIKKWLDSADLTIPTPDGAIKLEPKQQKLYQEMFEYIVSPKADMAKTRAFNFFWAMGGNVSTAMLNFVTMPTMVVGTMNTYGGNPLTNNAVLMRNFGLVSKMMLEAKLDVEMFGNETFLRKHIKDERMIEALVKAHARGQFRPAKLEDMYGSDSFTSGKVGSNGYVTWGLKKGGDILAAPIQAAEEISRVTSFMSLYETLREDKNPNAIKNFEANFVKGNHRYDSYKAMNQDLDPATYATLFAIEDTHGMFSKLGRGKNQQGIWGSLILPFMQHPLMMMGLMSRMARGNMVSKQAAMYMIFSMMMLAGLYGIPGWELWKEGSETIYKMYTGKEKDFHHELKSLLVTKGPFTPRFAEGLTEGFVKAYLGVDASRRMGYPIFFQDALIPLMNGQDGVDQVLGVAGSVAKSFMNDTERLAQGEINPLEMMYNAMAPVSMRNILKALVTYPTEGVRTGKGTQIMTPQDIGPQEMLVKAFGFQPSQVSREYEKRNAERLGSMGWRTGYNRYTLKIARAQQEAIKLAEEGRDTTKQQAKIRELYKDLADFAVGAGVPVTRDFWQGANTSIKNKVMNTLYPDIPKKESKAVDQGILNLLYEGQD